MPTQRSRRHGNETEVFAGLIIFLTMSYAVVAIPNEFARLGAPIVPIFLATCLVAGVGSFLAGQFLKTPTALAPGIAIAIASGYFVSRSGSDWIGVFIIFLIAGLLLLAAFLSGVRRKLMDAMPYEIRDALIGAIGAVIAKSGYDMLGGGFTSGSNDQKIAIVISIFLVVLSSIFMNLANRRRRKPNSLPWFDLASSSSLAASMIPFLCVPPLNAKSQAFSGSFYLWADVSWTQICSSTANLVSAATIVPATAFLLLVFFLLIVDIVGSPYQLLTDHKLKGGKILKERTIARSLKIDSLFSSIAPLAGTSPVVYYAENFAGRLVGAKSGLTAKTVGVLFLAVFFFALFLGSQSVSSLLSKLFVAPILLFVGLYIVSHSILNRPEEKNDPNYNEDVWKLLQIQKKIPAAIAIFFASILTQAEPAIAAGLIAYIVFHSVHKFESWKKDWPLYALSALAAIYVCNELYHYAPIKNLLDTFRA